ncbi:hypothetical protein [Halobacillus sp. B23F22_1]|uniref:hypothetical protein n=1 Tax=Halobacillus sp. B23F22_1 TaxID=3459514 RepID=UPI00373EE2D9
MKTMYIGYGINFIFGGLFYLVVASLVTSIVYIGDAAGWITEPALDEDKLLYHVLVSAISSVVYFSVLLTINRRFRRKAATHSYTLFSFLSWLIGFLGFLSIMFLT